MKWATPITTAAELEARVTIGLTAESETLEFKRTVNFQAHVPDPMRIPGRETARDIASLANTLGGTLLIGVDESAGGVAGAYRTATAFVSVQQPEVVRQQLDSGAVRRFLVPSTLSYSVVPLTLSTGEVVLAVNVPAHDHGVVAVWEKGNERCTEYPYRTSFGKAYMNPDEATERTMDQSRALELRLRRLRSTREKAILHTAVRKERPMNPAERKVYLQGLQDLGILTNSAADASLTTWEPQSRVVAKIKEIGASQFTMTVPEGGRDVEVPHGALVEVWEFNTSVIGLMLKYAIAIPMNTAMPGYLDPS